MVAIISLLLLTFATLARTATLARSAALFAFLGFLAATLAFLRVLGLTTSAAAGFASARAVALVLRARLQFLAVLHDEHLLAFVGLFVVGQGGLLVRGAGRGGRCLLLIGRLLLLIGRGRGRLFMVRGGA